MAFELHRDAFPAIAASLINPAIGGASAPGGVPLKIAAGSAERAVQPCASNNDRPFAISPRASVARGEGLAAYDSRNVAKAIAAASLGVDAEVGHASSNGALGPVSGASGITRYSVGQAVTAAAAGEVFSVYVNPRQLSNLI